MPWSPVNKQALDALRKNGWSYEGTPDTPEPVQSDLDQHNPNLPDYVKNRTHYDASCNVEWDSRKPDTTVYEFGRYQNGAGATYGEIITKVSDLTPSLEDVLKSGVVVPIRGAAFAVVEGNIIENDDKGYVISYFLSGTTTYLPGNARTSPAQIVVALKAGYTCTSKNNKGVPSGGMTTTIEEPGVYFYSQESGSIPHSSSFSWNSLKPLDEKYIPDTIARKSDLEGLGGSGGAFVVNFSTADMQTWSCDKTLTEITEAYDAGEEISGLVMGELKIDFISKSPNGKFSFGRAFPDGDVLNSYYFLVADESVSATLATIEMQAMGG